MNQAEYNGLREISWRRELSPAERARLEACFAAQPHLRLEWEADQALNRAFQTLPDQPVASNFTAQVLEKIARAQRQPAPSRWAWLLALEARWQRWLIPTAATGLVVAMCGLGYRHHIQTERSAMVFSVRQVSQLAVAPAAPTSQAPVEVWRDYDAIQTLNTPGPDVELLALLK